MPKSEIVISEQHSHAVDLHQRIITSATLAQQNLWDMCTSLKEMRDGKLYKELGYSNFEDYCENEVGMKHSNAYRYIAIVENVDPKNFPSMGNIGMTKLSLLATISNEEQTQISEKFNLEETTVKELKAEIDKLKTRNSDLEDAVKDSDKAIGILHAEKVQLETTAQNESRRADNVSRKLDEAKDENARLERENEELRNRPTEVAVQESNNDRELREKIEILEAEKSKQKDELECDKRAALNKLTTEYEEKIALMQQAQNEATSDDKEIFKVYFKVVYDSFIRLFEFAKGSDDKEFFKQKIGKLLNAFESKNAEF